jgi:2-haloalkanoic acid dehalogenase type II
MLMPGAGLTQSARSVERRRYDAVLFDLLTALLDSWSLWNRIAGNREAGALWRSAYLRRTYQAGRYRAYEAVVADAAEASGLPPRLAGELVAAFSRLDPWPEAPVVLAALGRILPLAIVTNCSERLGRLAAARTGAQFTAIVTAERTGFYKPHPLPYQTAIAALGVAPERCLYVAGSPYDLFGTAAVGLATYWHDRIGMIAPRGTPGPLRRERSLVPLLQLLR